MSKSSLEDDDSKSSKSNENNDEELSFQLSQEIYDMLLRNIVPESDENQNIIIGFENQRSDVAKSLEQAKEIKEIPNFTSIIKVNQKKTSKKAALVSFENGKLIEKLDIEQFGEISIAKVWIKHCKNL